MKIPNIQEYFNISNNLLFYLKYLNNYISNNQIRV